MTPQSTTKVGCPFCEHKTTGGFFTSAMKQLIHVIREHPEHRKRAIARLCRFLYRGFIFMPLIYVPWTLLVYLLIWLTWPMWKLHEVLENYLGWRDIKRILPGKMAKKTRDSEKSEV